MASVQYGKNEESTMQLSSEEKANLDEIIKHAESSLGSQELWEGRSQALSSGSAFNMSGRSQALSSGSDFNKSALTGSADPHCFVLTQSESLFALGRNASPKWNGPRRTPLTPCPGTVPVWDKKFAVIGAMRNQTNVPLSVMNKKIYSGNFQKNFPNPLNKGSNNGFCITEVTAGVKAGVVYSGKNKAGVECGWLLAFGNDTDIGMRVYAACGPKDKFKYIDWEIIETMLDKGGAVIKASDKATRTSLYAKIEGFVGKTVMGANFAG